MPIAVKPTQTSPVAPSTAAEAQAAALKMLEGAVIDDSTAPAEAGDKPVKAAPVETDPDAENPGEEKNPGEETKEEAKPEAKEEKKEGLPDPLKNSFERLAREKAEMRKETESLKAREAKVSKYEMIERAVANDDAMGVLQLHGLKYSTLVKQEIAKGRPGAAPAAEPEAEENPYETRIAALERTIREQNIKQADSELKGHVSSAVKAAASKYPNVSADPELTGDVVEQLLNFVKQTGKPPGDTLEESIHMALEAVELREEKAAQKYLKRKGLTDVKPADSISPAGTKSAVDPVASELTKKSRTLTNSHASAPRTVGSTTAETPEELRAKALALLEAQG